MRGVAMQSQQSKQFRWVGTLSEEELLGIPASVRHAEVDAIPIRTAQPPPRRPIHPVPPRARRPHRRDAVAVLGVGAAVWLAVGGIGNGLRFNGSAPEVPESVGSTTSNMVVERDDVASLPRFAPASKREMPGVGGREQATNGKGGKHDSAPPRADEGGEPAEPPLAEVTVSGIGTVTVERPAAPELPETEEVPPATPAIPMP
jgi:hypothetical protein